jgi:hypothetical protein
VKPQRKLIAAGLVWVTALLLPLQPFLPLTCACRISGLSSAGIAGSNPGSCPTRCCHGHVRICGSTAARRQAGSLVCAIARNSPQHQGFPLLRHCECPSSCPCHLRHSQQSIDLERRALQDRETPEVNSFPLAINASQSRASESDRSIPSQDRLASVTSSEFCAVLCRFTI